jgi:filamentous hemagglutinin
MASQLKAGGDASLSAGNDIALLAGQNYSYSLSEHERKGSYGRHSYQRDEVSDLTHVASSISGGTLALQSGGDQRYQAADLQSDGDLTLDSGGAIAFEGVKDVHQENHASSSNDWSWMKTSGEGWTDETLRQSALVAQGNLVIKAVEGIRLDIREVEEGGDGVSAGFKDVDQQSVSQVIDAMVEADPQMAWLKEMEQRGDIDWRRVKEVHDSYEYDQQGMGPATALAVAIAVSAVTSGAASALVGSMSSAAAGSGALMAAAGTTAAGTAVGAGIGNVMATAALTSMASTAAMSAINNGGDIDVVFKDVFSEDNLKNYVVAAGTAGVTSSNLSLEADLNSFSGIGKHAVNEAMGGATSVALSKALGQDASFHGLLESSLINTLAAAGFNQVGNAGERYNLKPGDAEMVAMHALMGGLVAKAQGGEFATGALAAGVNEAVVADMDRLFEGLEDETRKNLLLGASQLVGLLAAAALDGDEQSLETGAWVAKNSTQYNFMGHKDLDAWEEEAGACEADGSCKEVKQKFRELSVANDDALAAACDSDPAGCVQTYGYLLDDRDSLQERIAGLFFEDNIPWSLKGDLHAYLMQNQSAVSTLTQVTAQANLELQGFSPEAAALAAGVLGAAVGGVPGKKVSAGGAREKYDVGPYNEIKGTVPGLDAHHVGQKALMEAMIPGYDAKTAPAILVPKVGHTIKGPNGIVSRSTDGLETPRQVLARDIYELRRVYPEIPNARLRSLIDLSKFKYPGYFDKR